MWNTFPRSNAPFGARSSTGMLGTERERAVLGPSSSSTDEERVNFPRNGFTFPRQLLSRPRCHPNTFARDE